MKIALAAPFEEPVPPRTYGGTELVIYNLAEELVAMGHDVVVFASAESATSARLESIFPTSLRADATLDDPKLREAMKMVGLGRLVDRLNAEHFDVVHNHLGWRLLALAKQIKWPVITTFHGPLDMPYYKRLLEEFPGEAFVSISNAQRRPQPDLNYVSTVYNGIDCNSFEFNPHPQDYLVFLGRFSPEKGPLQAIECAKASGMKLLMAGKVDMVDRNYFAKEVEPLIDGKAVRFVGEVNHSQKNELLKNARALLMPIAWEEPFGLVMVEALATGTPVIANGRGSVPEIVQADIGFVTSGTDDMNQAIAQLGQIRRERCREYVCHRFGRQAMAAGYVAAYDRVVEGLGRGLVSQSSLATKEA